MRAKAITAQRTDISKYLIHWTPRQSFWGILRGGFFIANFAARETANGTFNTIRGNNRAICLTEMPVGNYLQSAAVDPKRYPLWGIAILKDRFYSYGARPVLYADENFYTQLTRLPRSEDEKYRFLFSNYAPIRENSDWTHEREWRVCPNTNINDQLGLHSKTKVSHVTEQSEKEIRCDWLIPLHLPVPDLHGNSPFQLPDVAEFVLLVETEDDKLHVGQKCKQAGALPVRLFWQKGNYSSISSYRQKYLDVLKKVSILSFEHIRDVRDHSRLWRIEDFLSDDMPDQ